jgi:GntR family transcriptional regulator / MocR family aminotransferase
MAESWAKSGSDLHLDVRIQPGSRVRAGVETALRDAVRSGRLSAGSRLPPSRSLAGDLGVARNTVADAYGQLVAEGWLTARPGAGTFVADRITVEPGSPYVERKQPTPVGHDLRPGSPDLSAFPRAEWVAATRRALAAAPNDALGYTDPRGQPELRRALVEYLARARGVRTSADRVVVCSGFVQALSVLTTALRRSGGTTVAVEAFGLALHREVIRSSGLRTLPVAVDALGARVDGLGSADAALLTPAHQFPTGVPLAPDRRAAAMVWARSRSTILIEDDYDGEFRYDRQPVGALQGLDPGHVIYIGTASKSLAPGLRLAWMALPAGLVEVVVHAKRLADLQAGVIEQLTLADLLASGAYDRQVRRVRLRYRRRRDRLVAALGERVPLVRVSGIAAGLHMLAHLPKGTTERDVISRATRVGLALDGLASFRYDVDGGRDVDGARDVAGGSDADQAIVLGYGTPPEHGFAGAVQALLGVLA